MYIRTKQNQDKHDKGVASAAIDAIQKGWTVYSDLPGNIKPPTIGEYIPDVYGHYEQSEFVIEIETIDSKDVEHSILQKNAFQRWKNESNLRQFILIVV